MWKAGDDIENIKDWFDINFLTLNVEKLSLLFFTTFW